MALPQPESPISPHDFWQRTDGHWDQHIQRSANDARRVTIGVEFENYVVRRLVGDDGWSWLDQLELDVVCRLCEGLGIVLEHGPKAFRSGLSSVELARATAAGFCAATEGKAGLREAFHVVKMASPGTVKGYLSDFGALTRWLRRVDHSDPRYTQIIEVFTSFVFENYALDDSQIVLGRSSPSRRVHSILGVAKVAGLSNARVAKFVAAEAIGSRGRDGKVFLEGNQCLQLIQEFADCVTCSEAKQELGLSFDMLDRLRRSGLITSRYNLAELRPVYHPDDINQFKKSVFKHAAAVDRIPKGYKPLNQISVTSQIKVEHVIRLAQWGQLHTLCFRSGLNGLWSLHADPREIRNQFSVDPPDGFTKEQLKSIFGLTFPTSNKLIKIGILKTRSIRHGRRRNKLALITKPVMKNFLKQYITLGMIVRDNNCQAYRAKLELQKLGVLPINLGKNCCKVYRRCEIEPTGHPIRPWLHHYLDAISELGTTPVSRNGRARTSAPVILLDSAEAAR
ncbi:hypothetical protein [Yoonia sp. 2307UL14-13]|uniref:hypothetical protein n=1 Tax=Yoonia sp. 2307UL14-13 TaxID=3126506 RepID=UPI0030A4F136